jgi:hypothetical protein
MPRKRSEPVKLEGILPVNVHALVAKTSSWREALTDAEGLACAEADQAQWWSDRLGEAQAAYNAIELERTDLTKPILDEKRRIDGLYVDVKKAIEAFKALAQRKIGAYKAACAAIAAEATRAAQAAAEEGDHDRVYAELALATAEPAITGVAEITEWVHDVVDSSLIPREYLTINEDQVKALCKAHAKLDHIPAVPGLVFKRVTRVRTTGRKK